MTNDDAAKLVVQIGALSAALLVALARNPDRAETIQQLEDMREKHQAFLLGRSVPDVSIDHARELFDSLIASLRSP